MPPADGLTADGRVLLVTDKNGVDENYGGTIFIEIDVIRAR
jgi:hypothetical protein